jgi:protein-tyrosine phosphatase
MIDFHAHVLPGMDDGSRSVEESVALLHSAHRQGVTLLAATPHFYAFENDPQHFLRRREAAWQKLSDALDTEMPALRLGAEVQYFEGICNIPPDDLAALRLEGSQLLLLEMPFSGWSSRAVADVIELNLRPGIQVLLAHIERYLGVVDAPAWEQLRQEGVLMQVNASFFLRWQTKGKALRMLKNGQIHLLGTDCHNMESRPPRMEEAAAVIRHKLGPDALRRIDRRGRALLREEEESCDE